MQSSESDILQLIVIVTIIILLLVSFIVIFLFVYQRRVYRHKRQVQKMREDFNNEMLQSKIELQEQVLNSVAAEIHDNLGQMLSVVKLNLVKLGRLVGNAEQETEIIDELKTQVSGVINDMRSITKTLSQDFISNFGLEESIKIELERVNKTGFISTHLETNGVTYKFDGRVQIVLFRITQELINNAIKHAEAKNLTIHLNYTPTELLLTVADDGKGFAMDEVEKRGAMLSGNGLRNMKNRVKIIGGVLTLNSKENMGTEIKITVPTQNSLFKNQPLNYN